MVSGLKIWYIVWINKMKLNTLRVKLIVYEEIWKVFNHYLTLDDAGDLLNEQMLTYTCNNTPYMG